jgi:hypothetical protein
MTGFGNDTLLRLMDLYHNNSLERLESRDCRRAYAQDFQSTRNNVILVQDNISHNLEWITTENQSLYNSISNTSQWMFNGFQDNNQIGLSHYEWICYQLYSSRDFITCDQTYYLDKILQNSTWTPFAGNVSYCLSEKVPEDCRVHGSLQVFVIVVALDIAKVLVIAYVVFGIKESPLLTIGDAIASFMSDSDPTTIGMCLVTKPQFDKSKSFPWRPRNQHFIPFRKRWFTAGSKLRWMSCIPM